LTFKSNILVSWVYKSHEQLQLGRHSQTPQNFSYYHAKLVFDLSSCSFHPKRLVVSAYKQCHVLPSAINLAYSGKTSIATVARRGSTTSGATSRSVNGKVLINPSTLVNQWIGSSARKSRQGISTYEEFGIQIYMYARWGK